jgi:hypothetical protein
MTLHVASFSGGKDSTAMVLAIGDVHGARAVDVTQDAEMIELAKWPDANERDRACDDRTLHLTQNASSSSNPCTVTTCAWR